MSEKKEDKPVYIPNAKGSLALLATGYRGVIAWREAQKGSLK